MRRTSMKKAIALVLLISLALTGAFGDFLWFKIRNPVADIEKSVKVKLNHEEKAIAELVMAYYAVKYGYSKDGAPLKDAYKKMSDQEYANAVAQAAKICRNDAAKGFTAWARRGRSCSRRSSRRSRTRPRPPATISTRSRSSTTRRNRDGLKGMPAKRAAAGSPRPPGGTPET